MTQPITLKLQNLGDGSVADFNFHKIQSFMSAHGPLLNTLRQSASRAPGGFSSDVDGQLVVFGAWIVNTGTGIGSSFGVGVTGVSHTSTGVVTVTLTETFPTDTMLGVTLPRFAVGATPIGTTAATVQAATTSATTIKFNTRDSSGTLVDAHFFFAGVGTLAT